MDLHLKSLFIRFQDQFGSGPGLGPGSGVCLMNVEGISSNIIHSLFRVSASLYRTQPWKRLRPSHLFDVRVGKDSHWSGKGQPFQYVQFIGGDGGDIAIYMYRSMNYALKMTGDSWEMARVPNVEVFRVTYESESLMLPSNKRMVKSLSLEVSGSDRFPVIDVARCMSSGELQFRNPTLEELRLVFAVMKALSLVHPLLLQEEKQVKGFPRILQFLPFIETVDVQWPPEMCKGHDFVAVTVSHPPGQSYEQKLQKTEVMAREDDDLEIDLGMTNLRVGSSGLRRCTMCEKGVRRDESVCCSHCRATIYCGSDCEKWHWREMHHSVCSLYEAMMSREEELKINFFTFSCNGENPCEWLGSLGIHKKGMWRRQCGCYSHRPFGLLHGFSSDVQSESWGGLEDGDFPKDLPIQNVNNGQSMILLSNWPDYYDLRSLPPSSPVSDILSYPLTLYYILTTLSIHTKNMLLKGKEVTVHYLGPERELDWIKAFAEINHLLNGLGTLQIIMVGPEVPSELSGTIATTSATNNSRVKVSFVKGLYQDEVAYLTSPDIVVALNCDLDGYSSWAGAVEAVNNMQIPGFFTDKTEDACGNAKSVLRNAGMNISHMVAPNPFRSPVRTCTKCSNLPCYSNGFILGVNT